MCSQSTFVKEILLRRLSGNVISSTPFVPAEEKEAVQSMVRRRVIGLDRSCMVSVSEDQQKSSCLRICASERCCKILTPKELKLKKTLKEFQARKLEEINARACRIEEENAQYEQRMLKMKKKLLEENQARLLRKKQKLEQNAKHSAMKYEEWHRKRTKNVKNQTDKKFNKSLECEISNERISIDASEQMVCSNSPEISTLPSPDECESSVCTAVPLNDCSSIKLNGIESASKYENESSQAHIFTDMKQKLGKSTCPQNVYLADDSSSADALLECQAPVPKKSNNSSENVTFDSTSGESQHQPPAASSSADEGPSEFFESEEVDCSSRRVDDLLEENDAFARLLDMVDGFPANNDGASALRALCTLDQGTIASLLSNKTLHWTPGGKMILHIFKQQDEPLIPTPVKRAFETRADDGERMCCDAPAHGQATVWVESGSRAPTGTKTSSVITGHEGSTNYMNTVFPTDLCADTSSVCDHSEERVNHLITENLVCDDPCSRMRERNIEQPVLPKTQTEMLDLEGCHEINLNENTKLCTKISSNYDMSDQSSLSSMYFSSASSCSNFLEPQYAKSQMEEFSLCGNIATTSGYSSIPHTSCVIYNCSDVTTDVNSAVIATNSAASFKTSISPAKNYLYHQPVTQSSIENRVDRLETMQYAQSEVMIETPKSFDMGMNDFRGVSVAFKTKASLETPSFSGFVSHAPKYNLAAARRDGTRIYIDNAHDGFHSCSVQDYSFPRHSSSVNAANQQVLNRKYCYKRAEKLNSESPYNGKVRRTPGTMLNKSSSGAESTSPVAYEECESPEPQDTCQSNQLTQEEFEAINGDGSGPIMMQILP